MKREKPQKGKDKAMFEASTTLTVLFSVCMLLSGLMAVGMVGSAFSQDDVVVTHEKQFDISTTNITIEIQNCDNLSAVEIYETNSSFENQSELDSWTFDYTNESQTLYYEWSQLEEGNSYYYLVSVQHNDTEGNLEYYNVTKEIDFTESTGGGGWFDTSGWFDWLPDWWPSVDWDMSIHEGAVQLWHFVLSLPVILVIIIAVVYWYFGR